jgi:hypothetical protein
LNSGKKGFAPIDFHAEFDRTPLVFSQVNYYGGDSFDVMRHQNVTTDGFELSYQREEALEGSYSYRGLNWVAIEAGSGSSGGVDWLAGRATEVTHENKSIELGTSFSNGANVIAMLSSYEGGDTAWARGNGSTNTSFDVSVEEETSADAETEHVPETVDYFVFSDPGVINAYDYDFLL